MMKMERPQQPEWLKENYRKWGRKFKQKLVNPNKSNDFVWTIHQGKKVHTKLLPILRDSTNKHCAFCDDKIKKGTIEHFRPTSKYPLRSYFWFNLFPSCSECQEKNNEFDNNLLRPDRKDYHFRKYFLYNSFTGEIIANPNAVEIDKIKAEITIRIYKLNRKELIEDRLDAFEVFQNISYEKRPYRFIFTQ